MLGKEGRKEEESDEGKRKGHGVDKREVRRGEVDQRAMEGREGVRQEGARDVCVVSSR